MSDASVALALIGIVSSIVAAITTSLAWTQKTLVQVLKDQISAGEKREALLMTDNRDQALTISKMGVSVDKLTEQGAQTVRLLEDVVYGRAQERRRSTS